MTLIRVRTQGSHDAYTQKQAVINASEVTMYEESNRLWWATEEHYNKDREKGKQTSKPCYDHAKTCTRVFLTSGQVIIVCQSFDSFDRTFRSMTSR